MKTEMSNLKFIAITTVMGLSLSYCLHLYHGDRNLREVDCNGYVHGKGLDKDGKPFQVRKKMIVTSLERSIFFPRSLPHSILTTCVSMSSRRRNFSILLRLSTVLVSLEDLLSVDGSGRALVLLLFR